MTKPARMRILHLSWEYPPIVYGGLGRHVHALAEAQAAAGHEVTVLTQAGDEPAVQGFVNGVRVVRVQRDAPFVPLDAEHLIGWVAGFNSACSRAVLELLPGWAPDVVHGHDWLVAQALVLTAQAAQAPAVLTIHATEAGRHQGWLPNELSRTIHGVEWWVAHRSAGVIVCSDYMRREVTALFDLPAERITVIPNGVDADNWQVTATQRRRVRQAYPGGLVVFTGRLEWEKGVHTLIDAIALVRKAVPEVQVVIAGRGSTRDDLLAQVRRKRLGRVVSFQGWLPEAELHALVAAADAVVVPSIYEPFGMVALEASSVATAVVASDAGGLPEVVLDGRTGLVFRAGDPRALADCLIDVLTDPVRAQRLGQAGRRRARAAHGWPAIAESTQGAYCRAISQVPADVGVDLVAEYGSGPAHGVNLLRSAMDHGGA